MALKQQLQQKQQQRLSPLQMQVIKLTELPNIELEERIKQELVDNPALDEGHDDSDDLQNGSDNEDFDDSSNITQEDIALGDYLTEDDIPDYRLTANNSSTIAREDIPFSSAESLHEFLIDQLHLTELSEDDAKIAEYIIGNIDENGYLDRPLNAISDDLLFQQNIDVTQESLKRILEEVQSFEPAGVGARDLQECLLLQLRRLPEDTAVNNAIRIMDRYFDDFSKRHFDKIKRSLNVDDDELKQVIQVITGLNPKPGNNWGDALSLTMNTIIPDFIVEAYNGELFMSLNNRNIPELRVNREYSEMLRGYSENKKGVTADTKNAIAFVKQKLDSAKWFIEAIKQRQETLQRTMQAIVDLQYDFFLTGDESNLRPMILKDIAELAGYDISTISRVSNSKYVQTNFGVYPLKYFFSESMQTDTGEEISSREVKAILKECIENEDSKKPLTDDKLADILKEKGYIIARRTVAKYREQMNIPVARLRKNL
ncbi:RNA polymerase factor sigma-54 [Dysgonomonas macrotermitis]|uniref:RNA polymerase, sigma 54 subunit, RpoN/SigL n=1 Tax=Dysgonomonas macrotermitis TaxID=1346286 RepID=A0A1M5I7Z0_9BACT|nr:RNA polymerase factor sigma-54 [Dysgonomonas macrotermitis]SHG24040.1 RNA polymerase, sigma 54 subunit, RpoN/SigL [Dysgonomonas macrotermitis]